MTAPRIVAISGSPSPHSRTRVLLEDIVEAVVRIAGGQVRLIDIGEIAAELGPVRSRAEAPALIEELVAEVERADLILAATPIYKGSYSGQFKHFVDLVDHRALAGAPVGLIATGGGDRHALAVEHQLRPLFGFFGARTLPTGLYVSETQHRQGRIIDPLVRIRADLLIGEAADALSRAPVPARAAQLFPNR
ncbi:NAD(P)H-dependent oxidoreductase [Methylopila henanensis]|uniref:NAD(P)H-dependent oxidoreductase n=1 Tax=Methylopila henanensis TaxID=873516 RepID=A0ABW4K459_9HYPH